MNRRRLWSLVFAALTVAPGGRCADLYVAPGGRDGNSGSRRAPFATLGAAQRAARRSAGRTPVTVHVAPGVYYLPETLVFTPADSGTPSAPVVYQADPGGDAVLSGGARLQLAWSPGPAGAYQAEVPEGVQMDQLWIDGRLQDMARFPNRAPGEGRNIFDIWSLDGDGAADPALDPLNPERIARWADPAGGYLHGLHPALWGDVHWRIDGKKSDGGLLLTGGEQNNRGSGIHPLYRMVENIFEELDAPGEWFHDRKGRRLHYRPQPGTDLATATAEIVRLRGLVEFRGDPAHPVRFISLRGFTFRHAARTFMDTTEPLLRSDWKLHRGAAILFTGAEDCGLADCFCDQLGGNSVLVSGYNRRVAVRGCRIDGGGASGVVFAGAVGAVRSPLLNYDTPFDYARLDRTPGPRSDDYPAECLVEDCLITRTGRVEKQTAGVAIAMSRDITVRHCSIYGVPRAGINLGDGCWGGHVIEFCDVFDTVLETGDHGSFNSWGRDRYWHPDPEVIDREAAADPGLPFLDVVKPITLRNNRWRCDHGWDVDLDDGSSHFRIYNNLFLNGGLKLREGFDRRVWNNIAVNNSLHPHVWLKDGGDVVTQNIWMGAYRPAVMPEGDRRWGRLVDFNLFASGDADRRQFLAHGCDSHSVAADPRFLDPARGDFRVAADSPALALGFKNFPMDAFGVQTPALKRLAWTPRPPTLRDGTARPAAGGLAAWNGATFKTPEGEEFSAYGVARGTKGVAVVAVEPGSAAAAAGLRTGDFIRKFNGTAPADPGDLVRMLSDPNHRSGGGRMTLIRNQAALTLKLDP